MYWKYFCYFCGHKWNVLIECYKMGLFLHGIMHDLSKILPSEFTPYANYFYSKDSNNQNNKTFDIAWNYHQKRNKHHWNYWVCIDDHKCYPIPMPVKYIKQMVADWNGMGRKFNDTGKEYYLKNRHKMNLHEKTVSELHHILDIR